MTMVEDMLKLGYGLGQELTIYHACNNEMSPEHRTFGILMDKLR